MYTSQMDRDIVLVAHNIRSTHNVGSLLRTCDGLGINKIYLTGYTPYPKIPGDTRLPHISEKLHSQIHKTALGAECTVALEHHPDVKSILLKLKKTGYVVAALEQNSDSILLSAYIPPGRLALVIGEEVQGVDTDLLKLCDVILEIPMRGKKKSFNVSVAAGIALYQLHFYR